MNFRKISMLLACLGFAGAFFGCDDANDMISGCKPGAYKCNGDDLQVCYGLNWSTIACPTGCDEATGTCKIPEGAECVIPTCKDDTTAYLCTDGKKSESACASGEICVTGKGCLPSSSTETTCTNDQKRCNGQTLESCSNNAWTSLEFCDQGCDEANLVCKTLQPGEVCAGNTCNGDHILVVCADDKQSTSEQNCAEDEICSNGVCVKDGPIVTTDCTADEVKCSVGNLGTISCNENGTWDEEELCPEGEKCDINQNKCVPEGEATLCKEGDIICTVEPGAESALGYFMCDNGQWGSEYVNCPEGQMCDSGEQKCVDIPVVVTECHEGDIQCVDDKNYQTCDAEKGSWNSDNVACEEGLVCDQTQNKCVPKEDAECENDEVKCADDANYYICVDGSWSADTKACGEGKYCDQKANKCEDSCQAGTYKCSDDMTELLKCDNHVWVEGTKCKDKQLCVEGSCKDMQCTPGVNFCDNTIKTPSVYKCTEQGQKGEKIDTCNQTFQCTEDGTACLICKEGDVNCTDKGVFQVCENNAWVDIVDCGGADNCRTAGGGPNNYNGCKCRVESGFSRAETKCSDDEKSLLTCISKEAKGVTYHDWDSVSCGGGKCENIAQGAQPTYACSCKGNDYSCMDNSLYQCNNGHLQLTSACSENEKCDAGKKACICNEGAYQCVERQQGPQRIVTREYCNAGKWIDKECGKSQTCVDNGFCASADIGCKENETLCNGNVIMKCNADGMFELSEDCGTTGMCTEHNNGPATCEKVSDKCNRNNDQRCFNGEIQTCKGNFTNYKWEKTGSCEGDLVCVEITSGMGMNKQTKAECQKKQCDDFKYTCEKDIIMYCQSNALLTYGDCGEIGMTCKDDSNVCVAK
ncbi:MAG: hypothetical protein J6A01_05280 [Proteobacteria bacterium]|nr:hypothetical protein [Pseudomonadota bacterium]